MAGDDVNIENEEREPAKPAKTAGRRATSNLRLARRTLEELDWKSDVKADYLVAEANVLALLELADSIRAAKA